MKRTPAERLEANGHEPGSRRQGGARLRPGVGSPGKGQISLRRRCSMERFALGATAGGRQRLRIRPAASPGRSPSRHRSAPSRTLPASLGRGSACSAGLRHGTYPRAPGRALRQVRPWNFRDRSRPMSSCYWRSGVHDGIQHIEPAMNSLRVLIATGRPVGRWVPRLVRERHHPRRRWRRFTGA